VKKNRGLIYFPVVFAAGFLAGVFFSAWKLDTVDRPASAPPAAVREQTQQSELQIRIAGLERLLEANPNNLQALIQLGNDYFDSGDYEKAVQSYRKALQIDPKNADVMTDTATGYRKLGEPKEAVTWLRKAVETEPGHAIALFNLGLVLRDDMKDNAGALKAWEGFLEKAGDSPHAVMVRPWVKKLRDEMASAAKAQPKVE